MDMNVNCVLSTCNGVWGYVACICSALGVVVLVEVVGVCGFVVKI